VSWVAEAARARVQHHDDGSWLGDPVRPSGRLVEYLVHHLHFEEVIAGTERARLAEAAVAGARTHQVRVCTLEGTA